MKTPAQAATKWANGTGGAQALYTSNAVAAAPAQTQNAIAQAQSWLSGVTTAGVTAFTSGLNAANAAQKYSKKIQAVGGARYAQGTSASKDTFQSQIGKVLQVEASVPLSPKGPKGSQANVLRSTEMQQALRAAKVAGQFQ